MFYEIENSGVYERKGMMQVRYSLYLEPKDYGYDKHHVQVPVIPKSGYPGKIKDGVIEDLDDYDKWMKSLPTIEQDNPFHNHFSYFEPNATDAELKAEGERILAEAFKHWEKDLFPNVKGKPVVFLADVDTARKDSIVTRINSLKTAKIHNKKEEDEKD